MSGAVPRKHLVIGQPIMCLPGVKYHWIWMESEGVYEEGCTYNCTVLVVAGSVFAQCDSRQYECRLAR